MVGTWRSRGWLHLGEVTWSLGRKDTDIRPCARGSHNIETWGLLHSVLVAPRDCELWRCRSACLLRYRDCPKGGEASNPASPVHPHYSYS